MIDLDSLKKKISKETDKYYVDFCIEQLSCDGNDLGKNLGNLS